jgi:putative SOS response-associated peptidase YedK
MCFLTKLSKPVKEIEKHFKAKFKHPEMFNSAVYSGFTYPATPVITNAHSDEIELMHWGLIPHWAKDDHIRKYTLNARIETIEEKVSFKDSVNNRCLIIADGFFEWQWLDAKGHKKQKYRLHLPNDELFELAGLWSEWTDTSSGEIIKTYTILTTDANELLGKIHNSKKRMPILVANDKEWLQGGNLILDNDKLLATAEFEGPMQMSFFD